MKAMKAFISLVALGLLTFVIVGFLLPGTWEAERTREVRGAPEAVFGYLADLDRWEGWSSLGQVEGEISDPAAGEGATITWDDPQWGQGVLRITRIDPPREVAYEVAVEEGSMLTRGRFVLEEASTGRTRVVWSEEGDFGWNPLLAYFALGMDRMQGEELSKGLDRLEALLDSVS